MNTKYLDIEVQLSGEDGNAFAILARCARAGREAGLERDELDKFRKEATSADYDHLLQTALRWFDCY
jgi:hypothetical protein